MATKIAQLAAGDLGSALKTKKVLVVGGTAGIGKEVARACLKRGAQVTIVGRRTPDDSLAGAKFVQKDLASMRNAVDLAKEVDAENLDAVIFTNGIFAARERQVSPEGIELDMAVSYLSRFAFAEELAKSGLGTKRSNTKTKPRIFVMGFPGQKTAGQLDDFGSDKKYSWMDAHMNTVIGNEVLVDHLKSAFGGSVNVYGLNPGLIQSEIRNNLLGGNSFLSKVTEAVIGWFTPSAEEYVENDLIHLIASPELEDKSGSLFSSKRDIITGNEYLSKKGAKEHVIAESKKLLERALASKQSL